MQNKMRNLRKILIMVHFMPNEGVDNGPVIAQEIVPIQPNDTLETLEERIHVVEHRLLIFALKQVFVNLVFLH